LQRPELKTCVEQKSSSAEKDELKNGSNIPQNLEAELNARVYAIIGMLDVYSNFDSNN
jgi:hypothetical protein